MQSCPSLDETSHSAGIHATMHYFNTLSVYGTCFFPKNFQDYLNFAPYQRYKICKIISIVEIFNYVRDRYMSHELDIKPKNQFRKTTTVLTFIFFGGFSLFIFFYLSSLYEEIIYKSFCEKSNATIQYISEDHLSGITDYEGAEFPESFNKLLEQKGIRYFVFVNDSGLVSKVYNLEGAEKNYYLLTGSGKQCVAGDEILKSVTPVKLNGKTSGHVYAGISSKDYFNNLNGVRLKIGLLCGIFFLMGAALILFKTYLFNIPLNFIAKHSTRILNGDISEKVKYHGNNEFSIIAKANNYLIDRVVNSENQVRELNRQLKNIYKEKIGELNLEVNQRRFAEASLKKSEEQFRLMFERAPIGMLIISLRGKILKVNKSLSETLNYSREELVGKNISEFLFEEDQDYDTLLQNDLIKGELINICYSKRFVRKDKEIIYAIVESVLVRDELNQPVHFLSQLVDITEIKKTEKKLIEAREKAEKSDKLKSAFLAQMSHEIRTPLNVILTANQFLAEGIAGKDAESEMLLRSVVSAGNRLQRTIDLILNISSIQSGNYEPNFEIVNLGSELYNLVNEFRSLSNEKNIALVLKNNVLESMICADKYTLNQIFQNLIGNAVKYTLSGTIEINIAENSDGNISVEVKDTGIGMSEEYMANLFTPFSQEDSGHKRKFEGNGLGLALVKEYVMLNNAKISVKSEKNKGSIFTVIFENTTKAQQKVTAVREINSAA
jgi:PAS domain S-box-containing protein